MRSLPLFLFLLAFASSCSDSGNEKALFCDTACISDSLVFKGNESTGTQVSISFRNCKPDSLSWTHAGMGSNSQLSFYQQVKQEVRLSKEKVSCVIIDTAHAWLTFNDCITGRGFLFRLPFNKSEPVDKILGALNSFDPKFYVEENLRAYTDRGNIYVVDILTNKKAVATFGEEFDIDFNKIHEVVDSVHVTATRAYAELNKNGQQVKIDKKISLQ
jgi:hypothetical protein